MASPWCRRLDAALLLASAGLGVVALVSWALGGMDFALGPLPVRVSSPLRPVAEGLALLLLREALGACASAHARLRFLALYAALLVALAGESRLRLVGDGHEYVAMAWNLSHGRLPAPTGAEMGEALTRLGLDPDVDTFAWPRVAPDGRHDFCHSWAYSALAAPLVRLTSLAGAPVLSAFTVLNGLLLLAATAVLRARAGPRVTLLLLGGAVLWWLDKAHTEVFVFSLLVVAVVLLPPRPGLSLAAQGLVGLQYPLFAVPTLGCVAWLGRRRRLGERGVRWGLAGAVLLHGTGAAYNLWRFGRLTPLSRTVRPHWPGLAELTAVLVDLNLGVVFAWPALALATALALGVTVRRARIRGEAAALVAFTAVFLLFVVVMPANLNSGGTRSMSRYALWLVPLCVPLLASLDRAGRGSRALLLLLAAGSLVTGLGDYHPAHASRYLEPTPLASWLWRRWPGATDPLPEVFAERTSGSEGRDRLPAATEGCEKVLLVGDGTPRSVWPLWCRPAELPAFCRPAGVYCYANRRGMAYSYARAPRQPAWDGCRPGAWYWSGSPDEALERLFGGLTRRTVREADPRAIDALFAASRRLGKARARLDGGALYVWLEGPGRRAWVALEPARDARVVLVEPRRGRVILTQALDPLVPTRVRIPRVAPLLLTVVPTSRVPPGATARSRPASVSGSALDRQWAEGSGVPSAGTGAR